MEVLLIIIAILVIGYFVYQSLPSTKFEKANELLGQSKIEEAILIYQEIFDKVPDAPVKLAECRLKQGLSSMASTDSALSYFEKVLEVKRKLKTNANKSAFEKIEAKAGLEIAKIKFEAARQLGQYVATNGIIKVKKNIDYIENLCKSGSESDFQDLIDRHNTELSNLYYKQGTEEEKKANWDLAINNYNNCIQKAKSNPLVQTNSNVRSAICLMKRADGMGQVKVISESYIFEKADSASVEIKNDFYFRHAVNLIKTNSYLEAEKILKNKISEKSSDVEKLKEIVENFKKKQIIRNIEALNASLDELYANDFPLDQTENFYKTLINVSRSSSTLLPTLSSKLRELRPSIFNRLLTSYIERQQFESAIDLISKYPKFWESPELLKNMGLCCFAFVKQGKLDEKSYKLVISSWLTAVFSDKVILNSLRNTTWDDDFTFTLAESIGSNYKNLTDLPENINYDAVSETNISIGDTQKELLQQFEAVLNRTVKNELLLKEVHNFYTSEKEALEKAISIIEKDIFFFSPSFFFLNVNGEILGALEQDYLKYKDEEALQAGIPYLEYGTNSLIRDYKEAKNSIRQLIAAINNSSATDFSAVAGESRKKDILKFTKLAQEVEGELFNTFQRKIDDNPDNERLIPLLENAIGFCSTTSKLKYQYSNFVSSLCVGKVNGKKMTYFKALELMKKAYLFSPDNTKVCSNIVTLIGFNLMDILNNDSKNSNGIYNILDEIIPKRSRIFIQSAKELADSRKEILSQMKKAGVDISLLTKEPSAIDLILDFERHSRTLTPEGEKMKKVLSYMKKLSDGDVPTKRPTLESLRINRGWSDVADDLPF